MAFFRKLHHFHFALLLFFINDFNLFSIFLIRILLTNNLLFQLFFIIFGFVVLKILVLLFELVN